VSQTYLDVLVGPRLVQQRCHF